jgi:hypothetical protein
MWHAIMPVKSRRSAGRDTGRPAVAIVLLGMCGMGALRAGTAFELAAHTFDSGGRMAGNVYVVQAAIGQPDADALQPATGGIHALVGGFLPGAAAALPVIDEVFVDGFED